MNDEGACNDAHGVFVETCIDAEPHSGVSELTILQMKNRPGRSSVRELYINFSHGIVNGFGVPASNAVNMLCGIVHDILRLDVDGVRVYGNCKTSFSAV